MNRPSHDEAVRILSGLTGGAEPRLLGQGMEGAVYTIDHARIAKIWVGESEMSLQQDRTFYDTLAVKSFRFATPRILEVHLIENRCVTIEQRLPGTTMSHHLRSGRITLDRARSTFVDVLADLAASGPLPAARVLPVMDEHIMHYHAAQNFPEALGALVQRRVGRFRQVLDSAVEALDAEVDALRGRLYEIDTGDRTVIHGDLTLDNILTNDDGALTAVLDWGFFTTEGDPAFDAAVAASIFDMYGESALDTELGLYTEIEERLGYSREALLVYRAAYSLITANAYDADGNDGHFAWCVAALNRPDVARALIG
jgi:aminoglycoside phosphotransferase (APT) family kinase protein